MNRIKMQSNPSKDKNTSTSVIDQPSYHGLLLFTGIKNCAKQILTAHYRARISDQTTLTLQEERRRYWGEKQGRGETFSANKRTKAPFRKTSSRA